MKCKQASVATKVVTWAQQLGSEASVREDVNLAKTAIGWALASRAAPILDSGSVPCLKAVKFIRFNCHNIWNISTNEQEI